MTDKLPPPLLALFAARPALKYYPPLDHSLEDRKTAKIDGVAAFLPHLKEEFGHYEPTESPLERRDRIRLEKAEKQKKRLEVDFVNDYKPRDDKNIRGTGFETLFLSRLSYNTGIDDISNHFKRFGRIERIRIVVGSGENDKKNAGKPRGYAFVQFENEEDMKAAYKASEHLVLNGRRVIVDVERGRTVRGWRPRRYGGGLGGRHYTQVPKPSMNRFSGPPAGPGFRGGGFRGGFRGGRGGGFGDRGGFQGNRGYGGAPSGAPAGPRSGGYGSERGGGGYGSGNDRNGGGGGYGRERGDRNANYEPVQPRSGSGYRDRDGQSGGGGRYDQDRRGGRPY